MTYNIVILIEFKIYLAKPRYNEGNDVICLGGILVQVFFFHSDKHHKNIAEENNKN